MILITNNLCCYWYSAKLSHTPKQSSHLSTNHLFIASVKALTYIQVQTKGILFYTLNTCIPVFVFFTKNMFATDWGYYRETLVHCLLPNQTNCSGLRNGLGKNSTNYLRNVRIFFHTSAFYQKVSSHLLSISKSSQIFAAFIF